MSNHQGNAKQGRGDEFDALRAEVAALKREAREEQMRIKMEAMHLAQEGRRGPGAGRRGRGSVFGNRQPLTRDLIADTAIKLMEKDGLDKVTMRKIAWELDTGPASLYVHVRNTADLHGHILDRHMADIPLDSSEGDWRQRLHSLIYAYAALLYANPALARSALSARPSGMNYLAFVERVLELLAEGGVPLGQRAWGVDVLLLWATANAAEHAGREEEPSDTGEWDALRNAVTAGSRFPQIKEIGLDLVSGSGDERRDWAFDVLVNGIAGTPRA